MEFEGQYLTYDEYINLGGSLDETPFNLLEFEARQKINRRTQNRLVSCESIPSEVKICEYKMINNMSTRDETLESVNKNIISSENTDGYSVSYITGEKSIEIIQNKAKELDSIIDNDLYGVVVNGMHILYLGVEE